MPQGFTKAIFHGIYGRPGQAILAHLLLETGAHWSGIPMSQLSIDDEDCNYDLPEFSHEILQPWGCMGSEITVSKLHYLEGLNVQLFKAKVAGRHTGIIIDWNDGFSRYPQEHKPLSIIHLENGQIAALPNNYFTLKDLHFTNDNKDDLKFYYRGSKVYWE